MLLIFELPRPSSLILMTDVPQDKTEVSWKLSQSMNEIVSVLCTNEISIAQLFFMMC